MKGTFGTLSQMTLWDSPSATSSPASGDGAARSGLPDGPTSGLSGPDPARVNLSARQASAMGLLTSGTFGPSGIGSSRSRALSLSLANRLRALLDLRGLTLFALTWRESVTPSGRAISRLRASAPRIAASGFGSWPSPQVHDRSEPGQAARERDGFHSSLAVAATWATPLGRDVKSGKSRKGNKVQYGTNGQPLSAQVEQLASWATPRAEDSESTGAPRGTPDAIRGVHPMPDEEAGAHSLTTQVRLATSGAMPTGSPAPTEKRGQLSPVLPCWLMGYPIDWILLAHHKKRKKKPE